MSAGSEPVSVTFVNLLGLKTGSLSPVLLSYRESEGERAYKSIIVRETKLVSVIWNSPVKMDS